MILRFHWLVRIVSPYDKHATATIPPLVAQVEIWSVVKVKVGVEGLRDLLLSNGGQQQQFSLARHPRKLST
jgi:hypothetical protein